MCVLLAGMVCTGQNKVSIAAKKSLKTITKQIEITKGKKYKITIKGITKCKIKSSNKKIATVSKKGIITGINDGKCTVKIDCKNKQYRYKVTVKAKEDNKTDEVNEEDSNIKADTMKMKGGYVAVSRGTIVEVEKLPDGIQRCTFEANNKPSPNILVGENVCNSTYYVVDYCSQEEIVIGSAITLYANLNKEIPKGTIIAENKVYITGLDGIVIDSK